VKILLKPSVALAAKAAFPDLIWRRAWDEDKTDCPGLLLTGVAYNVYGDVERLLEMATIALETPRAILEELPQDDRISRRDGY
jgi:hypothetical protein